MDCCTSEFSLKRRDFLKGALASLAATGFGSEALAMQKDEAAGLPTRKLGRHDERISIVGLGGYHIRLADDAEAIRIMHEAIDEGMTFFDNAWDYHAGRAEEIMGKALAEGNRRDKVFLMTKVCDRDYKGAKKHLEDSLRRLKTDHLDLWQFHEINWAVDADWLFDQGGVKAAIEARKEGKVRYIGFTGHRAPMHHLRTINRPFAWDTVQMPINIVDAHFRSFQKQVLPVCKEKQIAPIGMKGLAGGNLPKALDLPAELCRRFSLSLPITSLVCGIKSREDLRQDLAMARNFKPVSEEEMKRLIAAAEDDGREGKFEPWKTTNYGGQHHRDQHKDVGRGEG